jgi:uncharacterized protein YkwD
MAGASAAGTIATVLDLANSARLEDCRQPSGELGPLRHDARLDDAARRIMNGRPLEAATSEAGYRAKASASIHVSTTKGNAGVAQMLSRRFCGTLTDPELREIGAFQRGEETWLVLARPLIPAETTADALNQRVLELVNEARRKPRRCGSEAYSATNPLQSNAALREAAVTHARDMASRGRLGHDGTGGSKPAERATQAGYAWQAVAENIAAGQPSAREAVDTWLASPGHCQNLMNPRYTETGIAHAVNPAAEKGIYWVQVFAHPGDAAALDP